MVRKEKTFEAITTQATLPQTSIILGIVDTGQKGAGVGQVVGPAARLSNFLPIWTSDSNPPPPAAYMAEVWKPIVPFRHCVRCLVTSEFSQSNGD